MEKGLKRNNEDTKTEMNRTVKFLSWIKSWIRKKQESKTMLERKDRWITETKIELKITLEVLENVSDREVNNKLKMRQTEETISQKEQTIQIQKLKEGKQLLLFIS